MLALASTKDFNQALTFPMFIIDDILLSPLKGVIALGKVLKERAEEELYSPERIKEELTALQAALDAGRVSEEDYDRQEEALLDRLEEARQGGRQGQGS